MTTLTYLPDRFKSWYAFYQDIKPHLEAGQETICWADYSPYHSGVAAIVQSRLSYQEHVYSIRYIKDQALEELAELRQIQTFTLEELRYVRYAVKTFAIQASPTDSEVKELEKKVDELMYRELQKMREV